MRIAVVQNGTNIHSLGQLVVTRLDNGTRRMLVLKNILILTREKNEMYCSKLSTMGAAQGHH